jgi:hypothetical protein
MYIYAYIRRFHITDEYTGRLAPPRTVAIDLYVSRLTDEYISFLYKPCFIYLPGWGASKTGYSKDNTLSTQSKNPVFTTIHSNHDTIHSHITMQLITAQCRCHCHHCHPRQILPHSKLHQRSHVRPKKKVIARHKWMS